MSLKILNFKKEFKYLILINKRKLIYPKRLNKFLLNFFEDNNIDVEFNCRSGYCGICKLNLISGKVQYKRKPIASCNSKEILICSCIPVRDLEITSYI